MKSLLSRVEKAAFHTIVTTLDAASCAKLYSTIDRNYTDEDKRLVIETYRASLKTGAGVSDEALVFVEMVINENPNNAELRQSRLEMDAKRLHIDAIPWNDRDARGNKVIGKNSRITVVPEMSGFCIVDGKTGEMFEFSIIAEVLAEIAVKVQETIDPFELTLPKPLLLKLEDTINRWLEDHGLQRKVSAKPDLPYNAKMVGEAFRAVRDLLFERGQLSREYRIRQAQIDEGSAQPTPVEEAERINQRLLEISAMEARDVTFAIYEEMNKLLARRTQLERDEATRTQLAQPPSR
ncbi:MAG: hypothetical protein ABMA13_19575 [Chthoniobacteraceae bacterium]